LAQYQNNTHVQHFVVWKHKSTRYLAAFVGKRVRSPVVPQPKRGSALLFDYRVLHRGLANQSDRRRPVLVLTFAKSWFRDNLNFPSRSVGSAVTSTQADEDGINGNATE
jgi:ectoine hydroxylase-related dioxygenase (phytanoyl-CoA dioxygenase family)